MIELRKGFETMKDNYYTITYAFLLLYDKFKDQITE